VTFADARAAGAGGITAIFSGAFPENLPPHTYQVVVELQDPAGRTLERYEKRLIHRAAPPDPLAALSNEQLLAEYLKRGEALRGSDVEPIDSNLPRIAVFYPYRAPLRVAWTLAHAAIVRRGRAMVGLLTGRLKSEAMRNPPDMTEFNAKFGFAVDLIEMLAEIGDSQAVPPLVRVIGGDDGIASAPIRRAAVDAVERLTYLRVLVDRRNTPAMIGPDVIDHPDFQTIATLYRKWLEREGKDSAQWLSLAQQRARAALKVSDPLAVRSAITFFDTRAGGHDNAPEQTMNAIAAIIQRDDSPLLRSGNEFLFLHARLANYGPPARPYVDLLIQRARAQRTWDTFESLASVGGEDAMRFMIESLPAFRKSLDLMHVSPEIDAPEDLPADKQNGLLTYRACRWGIERWAGRLFESDAAIAEWWDASATKTQRQWLEESLEQTSALADTGDPKAQFLIRALLPDLPDPEADIAYHPFWSFSNLMLYIELANPAFRASWLKAHRDKLVYDDHMSHFVLAAP
jgi:hypothetical protein